MSTDLAPAIDIDDLKEYLRLKNEISELSATQSQLRADAALIEGRLAEQFALSGVQNMNIDGQTVYRNVERYANAKKEHRAELVGWARENDLDDMIVLQPASFKSWCREQLEEDGLPAEIAGMVEVFEKTSLRVRNS